MDFRFFKWTFAFSHGLSLFSMDFRYWTFAFSNELSLFRMDFRYSMNFGIKKPKTYSVKFESVAFEASSTKDGMDEV